MKQATRQQFPPGWNEKKVRAVIAHYDRQTEDEAAAEIETAPDAGGETWMSVPTELVGAVTRLIADHAKDGSPAQPRDPKKKAPAKKARNR
jgi:hypothetical protein